MAEANLSSVPEDRTRDWPWLVVIFSLVLALRLWLLVTTEVTARDSIGFIRYALSFESTDKSWAEIIKSNHQHPAYPFTVWLTSLPLRAWVGHTDPAIMQLAAQLVTFLAALAMVAPIYYLGKNLQSRWVGAGAVLLFQFLPVSGHHLSDGISDGLFLCWIAWGLYTLERGLLERRWGWFAWSSLFLGLGYWTRPEAALALAASLVALVAFQLNPRWRQPWKLLAQQGLALVLPALALGSAFVCITGTISPKPNTDIIFFSNLTSAPADAAGGPLFASCFGATWQMSPQRSQQLWLTLKGVTLEMTQEFHYFGMIPVLAGLAFFRRIRFQQGFYFGMIYFAFHLAILVALGLKVSYVSDRHVMVLVLMCSFLAVHGILEVGRVLCLGWKRSALCNETTPRALYVGLGLFAALLASGLPKTFERLHYNREGNHRAGLWIAEHRHPGDIVDDDHNWSHYYAGIVFMEGKHNSNSAAPGYQPLRYTVITRSRDPQVGKLRQESEEKIRQTNGEVVYYWPERQPLEKARVVVYAAPLQAPALPRPVPAQTVSRKDEG